MFSICVCVYSCCCYKAGDYESYDRNAVLGDLTGFEVENSQQTEALARHAVIMKGVIQKNVVAGTRGKDNRKSNIHLDGVDPQRSVSNSLGKSIRTFLSTKSSEKSNLNTSDLTFKSNETIDHKIPEESNEKISSIPMGNNENDNTDTKGNIRGGKRRSLGDSFVSLRRNISTNLRSTITRTPKDMVEYTPDTCFICLERYKVGDYIYWSKNDKCSHSFHNSCMMRWLFEHDDCPLCREDYVNTTD